MFKTGVEFFNCTAYKVEEEKSSIDPEIYELCKRLTERGYPTVISCYHKKYIYFASYVDYGELRDLTNGIGRLSIKSHKWGFMYCAWSFSNDEDIKLLLERLG